MSKVKYVFGVLIILNLSACLKIQKKSDVEKEDNQETAQLQIQPAAPIVFELNDVMSLTQDTKIVADKVILGPNARIYTHQFELTIQATTLDSAIGALIQNFPEGFPVAGIEENGLNGGLTKIKVDEAYGHLEIHMNAQQGGAGKSGWRAYDLTINEGCQPNSGRKSGNSGSFYLDAHKGNELFMKTQMTVVAGGPIGRVLIWPHETKSHANDPRYMHKYPILENCHVVPSLGSAGIPGQICIKLSADSLPVCEKF